MNELILLTVFKKIRSRKIDYENIVANLMIYQRESFEIYQKVKKLKKCKMLIYQAEKNKKINQQSYVILSVFQNTFSHYLQYQNALNFTAINEIYKMIYSQIESIVVYYIDHNLKSKYSCGQDEQKPDDEHRLSEEQFKKFFKFFVNDLLKLVDSYQFLVASDFLKLISKGIVSILTCKDENAYLQNQVLEIFNKMTNKYYLYVNQFQKIKENMDYSSSSKNGQNECCKECKVGLDLGYRLVCSRNCSQQDLVCLNCYLQQKI